MDRTELREIEETSEKNKARLKTAESKAEDMYQHMQNSENGIHFLCEGF